MKNQNNSSNPYPYTLTFSQTFISGNLEGITIQSTMDFVSEESAQEWVEGVNRHAKRNGYTVAV